MTTSRPILLISVQHSGTRFFIDLFHKTFGVEVKPIKTGDASYHPFRHAHTVTNNVSPIEQFIKTYNPYLIATKRNIEDIKASWERRGRPLNKLEAQLKTMNRLCKKHDPFIVSVDDDPEWRLDSLGELLGVEFETDWERVG